MSIQFLWSMRIFFLSPPVPFFNLVHFTLLTAVVWQSEDGSGIGKQKRFVVPFRGNERHNLLLYKINPSCISEGEEHTVLLGLSWWWYFRHKTPRRVNRLASD